LAIADVACCPDKTLALPLRIFDIVATDVERISVEAQEVTYAERNANVHPRFTVLFATTNATSIRA
jgi:hypothetical protein